MGIFNPYSTENLVENCDGWRAHSVQERFREPPLTELFDMFITFITWEYLMQNWSEKVPMELIPKNIVFQHKTNCFKGSTSRNIVFR